MKKLSALLFFVSYFAFSQINDVKINWIDDYSLANTFENYNLPAFNIANFEFSPNQGIKFKAKYDKSLLKINSKLRVTNYEVIAKEDLLDLNMSLISERHNFKIRGSKSYWYIEFNPIIYSNGVYQRVTSFNIETIGLNATEFSRASNQIQNATNRGIYNSVLNDGDWYRFSINETGIYKVDFSFLKSLGIDTSNLNSSSIQLFGFGGDVLPLKNSDNRFYDMPEVAIKVFDGNDGVFNSGDYLLFYGLGKGVFNKANNSHINPYSDQIYYYIKISSSQGKRITKLELSDESPGLVVDNYVDYKFHEIDEYNIAKMGRRWFGDRFDFENEKTFDFEFTNLITQESLNISVHAAAVAQAISSMTVELNGSVLGEMKFSATSKGNLASASNLNTTAKVNTQQLSVKLNYDNGGLPNSTAFLDYIRISGICDLKFNNQTLLFDRSHYNSTSNIVQYNITQSQSVSEVWDITDRFNAKAILNEDNADNFSFNISENELKQYVLVSSLSFLSPDKAQSSKIANQNLKGTIFKSDSGQNTSIDYMIITPSVFLSQANRLAQINKDQNNLNVKVVTLDEIFTEFSSGQQDVGAIRNFVKYVYDNANSNQDRLKYLCLFGDASFDYKNRIRNNTNYVPIWNSLQSFSLSFSFISDEFYAQLDPEEGDLDEFVGDSDLAVGRIIADSQIKARELVDKIADYYNEKSYGKWRNNYLIVSDDVDEDWEKVLQETTDESATQVTKYKPFMNTVKIHTDAYLQESTSAGERYPKAKVDLFDRLDEGAVVINYFGHGGEDGLASERVFDKFDAQNLKNTNRYNCFITVTCEFTKFDDPLRETAGEYVYWNPRGGAVGLITTTRQIYVNVGVSLNEKLTENLFDDSTGENLSIAEVLTKTKNELSTVQKLLVFFIGDPAMKLAIPQPKIELTTLNDLPIDASNNTIKALDKVKLSGEIQDENGLLISDYSGEVTVTVFDKNISRTTLGNDNSRYDKGHPLEGQLITMDFETQGEVVFNGKATVTNGLFNVSFVVPKDINFNTSYGKVSFYAKEDAVLKDKSGYSNDLLIGGLNTNAEEDNTPPTMQLFMNDESFVSGGITNSNPTLIVQLFDANGINTSSGVGHDISGVLDGNQSNPIILNNYYVANPDDFTNGEVVYNLRDLEPGLHTISARAFDVYNNVVTSEIQFIVYDENESLVVKNVLNYPNPFVSYTEFWFNHNSSDPLDIMVQIFTVSGKLVRTLRGVSSSGVYGSNSLSRDVIWDGTDDFGEKVGKGTYVYKLKVKSQRLNKQVVKIEKLVIL